MRASRLILTAALLVMPRLAGAQTTPRAQAGQAAPAAVTETSFDVDGDGAADRIRIEQPGVVHVALARGRALRERIDAPPGTLRHATISADAGPAYGDRRVVVVTATFSTVSGAPAVPGAGPDAEQPGAGAGSSPAGDVDRDRDRDRDMDRDAPLPVPGAHRGERSVAVVLVWQERALTRLWQGPVGWRGDGEHSVHVATTPSGLLRYQARPEVTRCDGQPVYLYPEAWDFRSASFRPVYNAPRLPENAPVLTAAPEPPPGSASNADAAASSFRTRAVSAQAGAASAGDLVPPRELDDRDPGTVWRETLGGNGRGEIITLSTTLPQAAVAAVRIVPGDAGSAERFRRANRLRRVGLLVGKERAFWVDFPTDPARSAKPVATAWWVTLPAPVPAQCVTLVLDSVYPGTAASSPRAGDTVISELAVLTTLDLTPEGAEAALIERVRAGGEAGRSAARLLAQRGPAAVAAVRRALDAGTLDDAERLRLRQVLAAIGDPATAPELAEGLADERASAAERRDFLRALVRLGNDAVPALAAVLVDEKAALPGRTSAARALGEITLPVARDALIAAAGQGPQPLRRTVALALGHRDPGDLDALLAALAEAERAPERPERAREADLWRAAGLLARRATAEDRARAMTAMAAMTARLASASGYELLGRLLGAAGPLGDPALLDAIAAALARLPAAEPESDALHRIAAVALADSPLPAARALLVDLLGAGDPGVRRAAADALGRRSDADAASDQALITRLREDTWPRIRHLAAAALATRCGAAEAPAQALASAITTDASTDVRRGALTALVTCRAPGIGALLLQTADNAEQPTPVRQRAITLVAVLGDRGLTPALVKLFGSLRGRAWSNADALRLASAAAVTLGRLGDPAAVSPLLTAARDPAFPELQAAAITGLAEMCPRQALLVFERAKDSVQRAVSIAARSASRRCARQAR